MGFRVENVIYVSYGVWLTDHTIVILYKIYFFVTFRVFITNSTDTVAKIQKSLDAFPKEPIIMPK